MKHAKYLISLFLLIAFLGCNENPIEPDASVEERINGNRPFNEIVVYHPDFTYVFSRHDNEAWNRIHDAFANDGYFVVITDDLDKKTYYFNLFSSKNLETRKGYIPIKH